MLRLLVLNVKAILRNVQLVSWFSFSLRGPERPRLCGEY